MGLGGIFLEGEDGGGLTVTDVDPAVNGFYQHILSVDEITPVQI